MMKIVAIIPARGGSKGVPKKNIQLLAGKPLIAHTIEHAKASHYVDAVYVSTDDREIATISRKYGAKVIIRPKHLATDTSTSESALEHALDYLKETHWYEPDLVVFLQCTSPIRQSEDIDKAIQLLLEKHADSLLSVCRSHRFLWRRVGDTVQAVNYDWQNRPRRQDMPEEFVENGSIYIFKPWVLRKYHNRLGGKIVLYEMDYWSSFEIDSFEDLKLCEWILRRGIG